MREQRTQLEKIITFRSARENFQRKFSENFHLRRILPFPPPPIVLCGKLFKLTSEQSKLLRIQRGEKLSMSDGVGVGVGGPKNKLVHVHAIRRET